MEHQETDLSPYADIIDHPHHVSPHHAPMTMHDRAAQFAPFDALSSIGSVSSKA